MASNVGEPDVAVPAKDAKWEKVDARLKAPPGDKNATFHTWTAFCNKVSVEILMTKEAQFQMSGFGDNDKEIEQNVSGFFSRMRKSYKVLRRAWELGRAEFGD